MHTANGAPLLQKKAAPGKWEATGRSHCIFSGLLCRFLRHMSFDLFQLQIEFLFHKTQKSCYT